ncbi:MAG TPA: TolC family protein [Saprospiraceae bacterium]|nr:TolC family protein [Saprospiraceae bacterium]HMP24168.1 TolC family protein [Saprospiraceae bacterium]
MKYYKIIGIPLFLFISMNGFSQSLSDYLQIAAEQNPELQAKYVAFEAAMQQVPQVGALPEPMLSSGVFINRMVPLERARFSLTQVFPWFGTLEAKKDAAAARAQMQFMNWQDSRNMLFFEIRKAYYELYNIEKTIHIINAKLPYYDTYEQLAQTQFQAGKGPMSDVVRVQIERNELLTELQLLQDRRRPLQIMFNRLLYRAPDEPIVIPDTLALPVVDAFMGTEQLLANPKIAIFEAERRAAEWQQKVVEKERRPMLEAGVQYMLMPRPSPEAVQVIHDGVDMIMPMVGLTLPIWRKKYDAMQQEMILMQRSAEHMKQSVANTLESQWAQAQYELHSARRRLELFDQQSAATRTMLELMRTAYTHSGSDFAGVLRTEQMLLEYRLMAEAARRDYLMAHAQIEFLLAKPL